MFCPLSNVFPACFFFSDCYQFLLLFLLLLWLLMKVIYKTTMHKLQLQRVLKIKLHYIKFDNIKTIYINVTIKQSFN